ncbi:MAG: PQQ-dependent dehydrogenase, methanol/ethanol family [Bryobacterales bacterium]|nr:PQQ-dependent dehydrogenase, methanol/ethanol family [Bryobacterales bacterium]
MKRALWMKRALCLLAAILPLAAQVSYDRLRQAESEPGNWLTYSGNYSSHRYSGLSRITAANVARLRPAWVYQIRSTDRVETSPLVVDGIMYLSEPGGSVTALDTLTGRPLWKYVRTLPKTVRGCCGPMNRGVAILGDMIYVSTYDAHVVALDMKSGIVRWDTEVADPKLGHSMTAAPLALKDKIVVGMAGGEYGVRGFIDAYDAKSGKRAWRFWTVPAAGEPGSETWAGDTAKTGAAATWVTGSYDPERNTVFWGTGNPGPDWNGDTRIGDNLYSDCLVALDGDTGKLTWYFQFTPHDVHDWDATEVPVLVDAVVRGEKRKVVLFGNRNAFYYVLDRTSGKFLAGRQFAKQSWARGLDDSGRPIMLPNSSPTTEGQKVYPDLGGGTNWFSPSFSPLANLFFVAARDSGGIYLKGNAEYKPGAQFNGGGQSPIEGEDPIGVIRALKPDTGELQWEFKLHSAAGAGLLSTAGNVVFTGTNEGDFLALDAPTGRLLWHFQTGAVIKANPVSYLSGGKQQVAIAAGNSIFAFTLDE